MCIAEDDHCHIAFPGEPEFWCDECIGDYVAKIEAMMEGDR